MRNVLLAVAIASASAALVACESTSPTRVSVNDYGNARVYTAEPRDTDQPLQSPSDRLYSIYGTQNPSNPAPANPNTDRRYVPDTSATNAPR